MQRGQKVLSELFFYSNDTFNDHQNNIYKNGQTCETIFITEIHSSLYSNSLVTQQFTNFNLITKQKLADFLSLKSAVTIPTIR